MQPPCASEFEHIEDDDDKDKLSCASVNIDIRPHERPTIARKVRYLEQPMPR